MFLLFSLIGLVFGGFQTSLEKTFLRLADKKQFLVPEDFVRELSFGHAAVNASRVRKELFGRLDANLDGFLSRKEFSSAFSKVEASDVDPVELHLAIAGPSSLTAMWVTDKLVADSNLLFRLAGVGGWNKVAANVSTYNAGLFGWHKTIYTAVMSGLQPDAEYEYQVGSPDQMSSVFSTVMPNSARSSTRFVVFGDQGTIQPLGFAVAEQVKRVCLAQELCDAAQVVGDLAYAWHSLTLGPELELLWDIYQNEQEQYASRMPMMTTVGNHELFDDAIAYRHRFSMPGGVSGGSEQSYDVGSPQYQWMEDDLAAARQDPSHPWIVAVTHRPFLSSDGFEHSEHIPGAKLLSKLEPLFTKYKVDLVISGHCHVYERIYPNVNGTVMVKTPTNVYLNPNATAYVVQGTGGAYYDDKWVDPQPAWSALRISHEYGLGLVEANLTTLTYSFMLEKDDSIKDQFFIIKG